MTRVNLVDPKELADQHLMAEYRELFMVPAALRRSLKTKSKVEILRSIPSAFTLGSGHVRFFYDKGTYLAKRYEHLTKELKKRGYALDQNRVFPAVVFATAGDEFTLDYNPTDEALGLVRARIRQRLEEKPHWYRFTEANKHEDNQ